MKKRVSFFIALVILLGLFAACGPRDVVDPDEVIDPNKTQIYAGIYNGGYGTDWLRTAASGFNNLPENSEFQVIVTPVLEGNSDISAKIEAGVGALDLYMMTSANIGPLINQGLLVDLEDMYKTKIPGEERTIQEKLLNSTLVENALSLKGEGVYGIPYGDGFMGFIFDYKLFENKGWLVKDSLDGSKLSAGPDKKFGTYDDGQPSNIEEWDNMLELICSEANSYPFVFTTEYPDYLTSIVDALIAQYSGLDEYNTFMTFEGSVTNSSGNTVTFTQEDGYKAYEIAGLPVALNFLDKYLTNNKKYVNGISWDTTSTSHRDAQDRFLTGYIQNSKTPLAAMLFEGNWWENEAKPMFTSLSNRGMKDRGYGQRDYRYMLFPSIEGQKGIDGNGHGSVLNCMDAGVIMVPKSNDAAKVAKIKEFIAFTCKDEYLQEFTVKSGAVRPFDYELTDSQYEQLTPFAQNVWQIYNDRENVAIVRATFDAAQSAFTYATTKPTRYYTDIGGAKYTSIFSSLVRNSAQDAITSMRTLNSSNWGAYYNDYAKYFQD